MSRYAWSVKKQRDIDKDIKTLKSLSKEGGYAPKQSIPEVRAIVYSCKNGYYSEVGISWDDLLNRAGIPLSIENHRNIEDDIKTIKESNEGKMPSTQQNKEINRIYRATLRGYYKKSNISWKDLLKKAGFDIE